jgi:hypothetical protein
MSQNRQPQGIPIGGQYAAQVHAEADLVLTEAISQARQDGRDADVRRVEACVMAMANETLRRHPEARYIVAEYSDQSYEGRLFPNYVMDAERDQIAEVYDEKGIDWCNAAEEYVGELDDSVRHIYERWATDEYLALGRRQRQEIGVEFDLDKIAADPALDLPKPSELDDGTVVWELRDGCRHRIGGPAIVRPDGYEEWDRYGLHHREDGPAVTWPDGARMWYRNGKQHREDGPAVVKVVDGEDPVYEWYLDGRAQPVKATAHETALYLQSKPSRPELVDVATQYAELLDGATGPDGGPARGAAEIVASLRDVEGLDHAEIEERIAQAAGLAAAVAGRRYPIRLWR